MLKRLLQILCLLPICATGSAYAVDCASNEFKYIDNNNNETCIENKFQITTTNDTDKFVFSMSAKGQFYVDWGDGNVEMINRTGTTMTEYSHDYASTNEYIIKFGGLATGYTKNSDAYQLPHRSCIFFGSPTENDNVGVNNTYDKLAGISGSLGALFPTIGTVTAIATQPNFMYVFRGCSNLTSSIPENLFSGISGSTVAYMFTGTFFGCSGLVNTNIDDQNNLGKKYAIPPNLFSGLSRVASPSVFLYTFRNCSGLTGTIPGSLFNMQFATDGMGSVFHTTFYGCSGLTGPIPANLFANVSGKVGSYFFYQTFNGCKNLSGTNIDDPDNPGMKYAIPPTLFSGITGAKAATNVGSFGGTFSSCSGLTGTIPGDLFSGISSAPISNMFYQTFSNCSGLTGSIPENLFSGISGVPANNMFQQTFRGCSGLSGTDIDDPDQPGYKYAIPPTLFSGISGSPTTQMFYATFSGCSELSGTIPKNLFSGISGKPALSMFQDLFSYDAKLVGSIPGNLFDGISGAPADSMFTGTFINCTNLTGSIPENLFSGIVGKLAYRSFVSTFAGCINLGKDRIGGTSTYYIPPELFAGIDKTSTATDMMAGVFANTGLLTTCPSGTNQYITGFESYFNGKKSCTECPVAYPDYDTTNQQCYAQVTFIDSDDNTLLKKEDIYYDGNNGSGYNLPSYSPVKPDTVIENWKNGSGTVIGANDVLTGNQVVYSDWGFHCDSGHYFHAGNEQICTAETKRTEHALVIKPDANHTYYIHATPNSEHDYTINSSSIHKMKVNYNGTIYNLHDASVYYDN